MVQPHKNINGEETPLFIVVIGTRPQIIKCALLIPELKKHFRVILINTGQHYDYNMNDIFFNELKINCDYNLGTTDRIEMERLLIEILKEKKPDGLIVIGDTDSTFVGAMAACKSGIKLIHIEAGLRSYNKTMPEEINRVCVDHLSDILFAPTKTAMKNLKKEGLKGYLIGDLQTDVQLHFINNSQSK